MFRSVPLQKNKYIKEQDLLYSNKYIIEQDSEVDMEEYLHNGTYDIKKIFVNPYILMKGKKVMLDQNKIWTTVYHESHGLCFTLDIRRDQNFNVEHDEPLTFGFQPAFQLFQETLSYDSGHYKHGLMYLHNDNDLPTLGKLTSIEILFYWDNKQGIVLVFLK